MPLTEKQVQNAKALVGKTAKLSDGGGLQLWVTPSGGKLWNLAYRFAGKQRKLAIGPYPTYSLKDARSRREEAKRQIDYGLDPSQQKRLAKAEKANAQANTFAIVAEEFVAKKRAEGRAASTMAKLEWLVGIATPALGARPMADITAPEILKVLRGVEARERASTLICLRRYCVMLLLPARHPTHSQQKPRHAPSGQVALPQF